jgi:hypothetical protein
MYKNSMGQEIYKWFQGHIKQYFHSSSSSIVL